MHFYMTRTVVALPFSEFNAQQRILECIKNSSCAKTDARQRLQKTIKKHCPVGLPVVAATCYTTSATTTSCSEKKGGVGRSAAAELHSSSRLGHHLYSKMEIRETKPRSGRRGGRIGNNKPGRSWRGTGKEMRHRGQGLGTPPPSTSRCQGLRPPRPPPPPQPIEPRGQGLGPPRPSTLVRAGAAAASASSAAVGYSADAAMG
jgi:hypothetical protein